MRAECRRGKALGEPYEGKPHVRFDEGVLETEPRRGPNGHEAGNGGYGQDRAYGPPRQRSTLHAAVIPRFTRGRVFLVHLAVAAARERKPWLRLSSLAAFSRSHCFGLGVK